MAFIDTIDADRRNRRGARDVRAATEELGLTCRTTRSCSAIGPQVLAAWAEMIAAIRAPVDTRTFELVTFAAACALGSSSCSLAHGKKLLERFLSPAEVAAHRLRTRKPTRR